MIVREILGNIENYPVGTRKIEKVYLEWYELGKKRMRKALGSGGEIGICLDSDADRCSHSHLHEGDILYEDNTRVIIVEIVPCELTVIEVTTMKEMGRLCFELGNRHLSLAIKENKVIVPYDEPTFCYLGKMGFSLEKTEGRFSHFIECHAHGNHSHDHNHDRGEPAQLYDYEQYAHTKERNNE